MDRLKRLLKVLHLGKKQSESERIVYYDEPRHESIGGHPITVLGYDSAFSVACWVRYEDGHEAWATSDHFDWPKRE